MYTHSIIAGVLVSLMIGGPATALTLINEDEEPRTVTIKVGDIKSRIVISAQELTTIDCQTGCTLQLASGDKATFVDEDEVVISEGAFSIEE